MYIAGLPSTVLAVENSHSRVEVDALTGREGVDVGNPREPAKPQLLLLITRTAAVPDRGHQSRPILDLTELLLLKKQLVKLSHSTVAEGTPRLKHDIDKRTNQRSWLLAQSVRRATPDTRPAPVNGTPPPPILAAPRPPPNHTNTPNQHPYAVPLHECGRVSGSFDLMV